MASSNAPRALGRPERVIKWNFHLQTRSWSSEELTVSIDQVPFNSGSMRTCFHMVDNSKAAHESAFVAKLSNDANDNANVYRQDVEMQHQCQKFAELYNRTRPPKPVHFLSAFLIECIERPDKRIYFVEPLLRGAYRKYSNNYGFVQGGDAARNTPQAFSHFTYHVSGGLMLVCDLQGVDDVYTDPQIHTVDAVFGRRDNRFGKGNVGTKGIRRFFQTHRCNNICQYLELPTLGKYAAPPMSPGALIRPYPPHNSPHHAGMVASKPYGAAAMRPEHWASSPGAAAVKLPAKIGAPMQPSPSDEAYAQYYQKEL